MLHVTPILASVSVPQVPTVLASASVPPVLLPVAVVSVPHVPADAVVCAPHVGPPAVVSVPHVPPPPPPPPRTVAGHCRRGQRTRRCHRGQCSHRRGHNEQLPQPAHFGDSFA